MDGPQRSPQATPFPGPRSAPVAAPSDENLLRMYLDGVEGAFADLVARYRDRVYGYALNQTGSADAAGELFQEVFLRVARGSRGFRFRSSFSTWLHAITTNTTRAHLARRRREEWRRRVSNAFGRKAAESTGDDLVMATVRDPQPDAERRLLDAERLQGLRRALAALPDKQRSALVLTKIEGLSLEETARALSLNLNTVKTLVRRARLRLARELALGETT